MNNNPPNYRLWIYLMVFAGLVIAGLFSYEFFYRYPIWTLRAFHMNSMSMCPTICNGEMVFVKMQYGKPYVPHKGDVIAFEHGSDPALFIKRVIGLPGDIVAPGPGDIILVNGSPWQAPPICAKSLLPAKTNPDKSPLEGFKETPVPPGELFVIGDNLYNSFDSRIDQFGPVTFDRVVGKPVMIYWSPESARVGCPIR